MRDCPHWPDCGCGTQSGPHTCEWRNRDKLLSEAAAFLDRLAERVARAGYPDLLAQAAADCRTMAKKLRGKT